VREGDRERKCKDVIIQQLNIKGTSTLMVEVRLHVYLSIECAFASAFVSLLRGPFSEKQSVPLGTRRRELADGDLAVQLPQAQRAVPRAGYEGWLAVRLHAADRIHGVLQRMNSIFQRQRRKAPYPVPLVVPDMLALKHVGKEYLPIRARGQSQQPMATVNNQNTN
jgi:hypothetical protein